MTKLELTFELIEYKYGSAIRQQIEGIVRATKCDDSPSGDGGAEPVKKDESEK